MIQIMIGRRGQVNFFSFREREMLSRPISNDTLILNINSTT